MGNNRRRHRFAGLLLIAALLMTALSGCGSARRDMAQEEQEGQGAKDTPDVQETREEQSKPITMADMIGESEIGQERKEKSASDLPDTILWFNATYAPLTYSNGWNWRLVGGLEPTEENIEITEMLLQSSWSVKDRETGLETVKNLIQKGHRGKCREYTEQMEEWEILDLGEEEFIQQIVEKDVGNELGRYAVAYYMHKSGMEPEYMVAWDLCRVNQLYADYYLCGYMTYEEAMDASLTNSLKLQELYDSWEEMMDGYMTGYMFWQGDLMLTDDSPTKERYHYYEMLKDMENGPYTLDWNMELEKSW